MPLSEPIQSVPYRVLVPEVFKLVMHHNLRRFHGIAWIYPIAGVMLLILPAFMTFRQPFVVLTIAVGCLIVIPANAVQNWIKVNKSRRLFECEKKVIVCEEHLFATDAMGNETKIVWSMFHHVNLVPGYLLMYIDKNRFMIFPQRAFTREQFAAFIELLRENKLLR